MQGEDIEKSLKVPNGFSRAQKITGGAKRAARGAANAGYNKASRPAGGMFRGKEPVDDHGRAMPGTKYAGYKGKWGRLPNGKKIGSLSSDQKLDRSSSRQVSYVVGLGAGGVAGGAASIPVSAGGSKRDKQIKANRATIRANNKKIKGEVGKAFKMPKRPHLVTDMGTKASREKSRGYTRFPGLRPGALAGGAAVGTVATLGVASATRDAQKQELKRQGKRIANQEKKLVNKSGSKGMAEQKATGGRLAAGGLLPGYHGAFAGKKGRKLRAMGNEVGGNIAGGLAGGLAAGVASRGKLTTLGTAAGGIAGGVQGTKRAQAKGHYKVQKNDNVSAFGIVHKSGDDGTTHSTGGCATPNGTSSMAAQGAATKPVKAKGKRDKTVKAVSKSAFGIAHPE